MKIKVVYIRSKLAVVRHSNFRDIKIGKELEKQLFFPFHSL